VFAATMKLYSLTVMYKGLDGRVKKLCSASDLASFGYFQRSRLVVFTRPLCLSFGYCIAVASLFLSYVVIVLIAQSLYT